jgi:hypothetical protein
MSYEFDRSYIEEVIMLSALTLFLVLAKEVLIKFFVWNLFLPWHVRSLGMDWH